jgi:hypothetical protein
MSPAASGIVEETFTLLNFPEGILFNWVNVLFIRLWRNPGRSVPQGGNYCYWSRTEGHLERGGSATEPYGREGGASCGNAWCEGAEVSRGHSSLMPGVMPGTW